MAPLPPACRRGVMMVAAAAVTRAVVVAEMVGAGGNTAVMVAGLGVEGLEGTAPAAQAGVEEP